MPTPGSSAVYNNATAMVTNPSTPGLNGVITSWAALQAFTGGNSVARYNSIQASTALLRGIPA